MKKILSIILILAFLVSTVACQTKNTSNIKESSQKNSTYPMSIKDSYNREVKIEKEPKRIISIAPNITETIFAIGKGDALVGRTDYCDFPKEVLKIQSVGTLKQPSIEKIAELKPDLVIGSTHFSKDTLKKLDELGIPTVVLYGEESFEGTYETILKAGKLLNAEKNAQELIDSMKKKVEDVKKKVEGKSKPSVYYVIGYGKTGDFTAGKNTFISQMIELAGGTNSASDVEGWKYSLEKLLENNPQIMICPVTGGYKQGIVNTNGYKELRAVKENKLFEIDENLINRQGPRIADGLVGMAKIIHPELFSTKLQ